MLRYLLYFAVYCLSGAHSFESSQGVVSSFAKLVVGQDVMSLVACVKEIPTFRIAQTCNSGGMPNVCFSPKALLTRAPRLTFFLYCNATYTLITAHRVACDSWRK